MSRLYLAHHGIKGQKWGVRRYQNEDGSYTNEGNKRRKKERKPLFSNENTVKARRKNARKAALLSLAGSGTAVAGKLMQEFGKEAYKYAVRTQRGSAALINGTYITGKILEGVGTAAAIGFGAKSRLESRKANTLAWNDIFEIEYKKNRE